MCGLLSISDQKPFGEQRSGIQGPGNQTLTTDPAALWNIQDRLGLADPVMYFLYCSYRTL